MRAVADIIRKLGIGRVLQMEAAHPLMIILIEFQEVFSDDGDLSSVKIVEGITGIGDLQQMPVILLVDGAEKLIMDPQPHTVVYGIAADLVKNSADIADFLFGKGAGSTGVIAAGAGAHRFSAEFLDQIYSRLAGFDDRIIVGGDMCAFHTVEHSADPEPVVSGKITEVFGSPEESHHLMHVPGSDFDPVIAESLMITKDPVPVLEVYQVGFVLVIIVTEIVDLFIRDGLPVIHMGKLDISHSILHSAEKRLIHYCLYGLFRKLRVDIVTRAKNGTGYIIRVARRYDHMAGKANLFQGRFDFREMDRAVPEITIDLGSFDRRKFRIHLPVAFLIIDKGGVRIMDHTDQIRVFPDNADRAAAGYFIFGRVNIQVYLFTEPFHKINDFVSAKKSVKLIFQTETNTLASGICGEFFNGSSRTLQDLFHSGFIVISVGVLDFADFRGSRHGHITPADIGNIVNSAPSEILQGSEIPFQTDSTVGVGTGSGEEHAGHIMNAYDPFDPIAVQTLEIVLCGSVLFQNICVDERDSASSAKGPHRVIRSFNLRKTAGRDERIDLIPVILAFSAVTVRLLVMRINDFHAEAVFHNNAAPFLK